MNIVKAAVAALFTAFILVGVSAYSQTVIWEQDCFGDFVDVTPISGGYHVVCGDDEPEPTLTPTSSPNNPVGNQLINPCFDGRHNYDPEYWEQTPGWDVSAYKNPCGPNGTAARIANEDIHGESAPGVDESIWQVVNGNGSHLIAELQCIDIGADYMDMVVYGGNTENGSWIEVWRPFDVSICNRPPEWGSLQHLETTISESYPFYKIEIKASFYGSAIKVTSAYFESR